jgi:hypothetical protein
MAESKFFTHGLEIYAISDYNQKEEWWVGYFFIFFFKVRKEVVKIKLLKYDHVRGDR